MTSTASVTYQGEEYEVDFSLERAPHPHYHDAIDIVRITDENGVEVNEKDPRSDAITNELIEQEGFDCKLCGAR